MKGRNPLAGRHSAGAPIARSGVNPPKRTGPAGLRAPGARTYKQNVPITSATLLQTPSQSASNQNYKTQMQQWLRQSPEPFRNPQPSANPAPMRTKDTSVAQSGADGGFYRGYKGNRISEQQVTSKPLSQDRMDSYTGHTRGVGTGRTGRYSVTSGWPLSAVRGMKADSNPSNQPSAKKPAYKGQTSNFDIFNEDTVRPYKRL